MMRSDYLFTSQKRWQAASVAVSSECSEPARSRLGYRVIRLIRIH